jgi:tetratricopeptide (TPR) repeat protein
VQRLPFFSLGIFVLFTGTVRADTVLVLPFFNESNSRNIDWIGESIAETIRESLASRGVLMLSRDDRLEGYRRLSIRQKAVLTHATIIKLGEALDADQVIYGTYALAVARKPESGSREQTQDASGEIEPSVSPRDSLRISARILDLKSTHLGPEFKELGALEDLASLDTHLAWQCLESLEPKTAPTEQEFRRDRPALRLDAVENYIRGLLASSDEQKHRLFTQAARLDPRFSEPNFQLGKMAWNKKDFRVAQDWLQKVIRTDSHYHEAMFLLGLCRYNTGDFAGAEKAFQIVATAVPLNEVLNDLGAAESRLRSPAALENFRKALEGDATDPDYHFNVGYALWKQGDYTRAAQSFRAALDRNPEDSEAVLFLGRCLKGDGQRVADPKSEGRERLKLNFEEIAYRQLKAELDPKH